MTHWTNAASLLTCLRRRAPGHRLFRSPVPAAAAAVLLALLHAPPAHALDLTGQLAQGGLVKGQAAPGTALTLDGKRVPVASDGTFLLGFGRDQEKAVLIQAPPGGAPEVRILPLEKRAFDIQRIDGLPHRKVTPLNLDLARIKGEKQLMAAGRAEAVHNEKPFFESGFAWPAKGPVSGVYGSQRILNGKPRRPHYGVDIAAPIGSEVRAMADGVVRVAFGAGTGMFFNGKTVLLDHGLGLTSVYIHMDKVSVKISDFVNKNDIIGAVGSSGRSTGPHLHWGVTWNGVPVDPELLPGLPEKP